tara:strand:- start:12962 stop:13198 length:237 start_codon:yes stop_codon:yes gene_type:complete
MYDCKLCGVTCYTTYLCQDKCNRIKDMVNLYGVDTVLDVLETVLIRSEKQRNFKLKQKLNEEISQSLKIGNKKEAKNC